jgi:hypothetical protein
MFYETLLEKRAAVTLTLPKRHDRTHADAMRSHLSGREGMTDDELIDSYARRTSLRGRALGAALGAGVGLKALPLTLGSKDTLKIEAGDGLNAYLKNPYLGAGVGAVIGAGLGGHYGRDYGYHVGEKGLARLRPSPEDD